jgi:hypothetical protein
MALLPIPSHAATVQGGGEGYWIPFAYGEMRTPHTCHAKVRTQNQYSFAEPVAANKQNGRMWF